MKSIKQSVLQLSSYSVSQDQSLIKLNQNESPVDIPENIKKEIFKRIKKESWNRYPPQGAKSLIQKISDYTEYPSSGIMVGNGSNELIQAIIYAVCDSDDRILTVQPGFSIYKRVSSVMNIKVREVRLKHDFSFDANDIIEKSKGTKMIILCSPNNPTGTVLKIKDVEKIAQNFHGIIVLDEAYQEFYKKTGQKLINKFNNMIILRTFSKALGSAGIRLGYLLGSDEIVKDLYKAKLPFSLGIFQQVAGEVILEKKEFIKQRVSRIIKEREWILSELKKIRSIHPIPSYANFILFESQWFSGKDLNRILFENRILVRTFDDPGLKNMLRVTVGTHEENEAFLEKLKKTAEGDLL